MTTLAPNQSTGFIARPGKLMRLIALAKAMLEEARTTPCDAAGCEQFKAIYERTIDELDGVISPELHEEITELAIRFDKAAPSPSALRIAQAELVGWLDGLMSGVVIAVQGQQIEAEAQVAAFQESAADDRVMPGQYL